jgi:hypothetical protein
MGFDPAWISLQFAPYGFNDKGIVWNLAAALRALVAGRPLQVMLHELWIGEAELAPAKDRMVGLVQRHFILRMLRILRPAAVNTSNEAYIAMLGRAGIHASLLPLFGNVPVAQPPPGGALPEELLEAGVPTGPAGRGGWWVVILFGSIHPEWVPEAILGILHQASRRAGKRICIVSVGRVQGAGEAIWNKMSRDYCSKMLFVKAGEQPAARLSLFLRAADFAIATSPWQLIGKSGSATAMLEHGVPVIVTRDDVRIRTGSFAEPAEPLLHRCDETLEAKLAAGLQGAMPRHRLPAVAHAFLEQFTNGVQ